LSCIQLHKRAERIAAFLVEKAKLPSGSHVALILPAGLDLITAFYGCLYAGKFFSSKLFCISSQKFLLNLMSAKYVLTDVEGAYLLMAYFTSCSMKIDRFYYALAVDI
jgi:acyl-coenzyme A synthetase/AMP-(fatty) acid ligase